MSEKSFVALEQAVCPVCARPHDTGVLIHKRFRNVLEPKIVTHWELCEEHAKLKADGFIALVGADPAKSSDDSLSGVWRTGKLAFLKSERWSAVFNVPVPPKGLCFVDDAVIEMLTNLQPNHDQDQNHPTEAASNA